MNWVLVIGLLMNAIALPIVGRRVVFLYRLITAGQPAPARIEGVTGRLGAAVKRQVVEVFGQKKLLKWSLPGAAHFFVFWAFVILASVYLEAYGALFDSALRDPAHRALGRARVPAGLHRADGAGRHHDVRDHPHPQLTRAARPPVAVQGLAPRRRLGRAVHDLQRHLVAVPVPRRGLGAGQPALRQRRVRLDRRRQLARRAEPRDAGVPGAPRPAAPHRHHAGLPDRRGALQAPPHLRRADQRDVRPPARGARALRCR